MFAFFGLKRESNPYRLAWFLAVIFTIIIFFGQLLLYFILGYEISWITIIIGLSIILLLFFLILRYILEKYIYERIKLIYKTIHNFKLSKDNKNGLKYGIHGDLIHSVNKEVETWAADRKQEIDELRKMEVYRREFLGNVSHELKTPLFNIQGFVLTLLEGGIDDPAVNMDFLSKTQKNIERMITIVEDLEIISRLETGEATPILTKFSITQLVREVFELMEPKASQRHIRLTFAAEYTDNIIVEADKEKIREVFINLVVNSINYGKEGGRTKISFYDMDDNYLIEVSDNGVGIAEQHIPRLFERFYRVDKHRSRNDGGGSGLGLAIVKHIIEAHKQTINVRSAVGVGSTFSFTLKKV